MLNGCYTRISFSLHCQEILIKIYLSEPNVKKQNESHRFLNHAIRFSIVMSLFIFLYLSDE